MQTFISIKTYHSYITANMELMFLINEYINCHLQNENTMLADPLLGNAIGGIQLMVHHTQVDRALSFIKEFEKKD
jgi:hypothetical protein